MNRILNKDAAIAAGQPIKKEPVKGRRMYNDPVRVRQRVLNDAARKNEGTRPMPKSTESTMVCTDDVCKEVPATLRQEDLRGLDENSLLSLMQSNFKAAGIYLPNHFKPAIDNFMGFLKSQEDDETINSKPPELINNLVLITEAIRSAWDVKK